jgi:hypothetical protein
LRLKSDHQQQELFEEEEPPIALSFEQRLRVLSLVQAMLAESDDIGGRGGKR